MIINCVPYICQVIQDDLLGVSEFQFLSDKDTIDFITQSHTMFILRGVPGSGKSTLAKRIQKQYPESVKCSADDFFIDEDGIYRYVTFVLWYLILTNSPMTSLNEPFGVSYYLIYGGQQSAHHFSLISSKWIKPDIWNMSVRKLRIMYLLCCLVFIIYVAHVSVSLVSSYMVR